jgi:hypothetical protein
MTARHEGVMNRGGKGTGRLVVKLFNSAENREFAQSSGRESKPGSCRLKKNNATGKI